MPQQADPGSSSPGRKISKSNLTPEQQAEMERRAAESAARLADASRCRHFAIGTFVQAANQRYEILDASNDTRTLLLRAPDGTQTWIRRGLPR